MCLPLLGAIFIGSCSDGDLFSPNRDKNSAQIGLRAYYGSISASQSAADINRIRLTVTVLPSGPSLSPVVVDVDPAATEWNLPIEVPPNSDLSVLVELISVVGGVETVQFSGILPAIRVTSGPQPPAPAVAVYPGPPGNLSVTAISVTPRDQTVLEGLQIPLTANVSGSADARVIWSSSNSEVATVDANGIVQTLLPGSATITATAGRVADAVTITVGGRATSVVIAPANPTATSLDQEIALVANVVDARNNPVSGVPVQWTVADAGIARHVGGGLFKSVRNGSTQVTATARQGTAVLSATTTLTVQQQAASMSISPTSRTFGAIGLSQQFSVSASDAGGHPVQASAITWESSNPAVATVNANGLVTSAGDGTATIRARSGEVTAEATVIVARPASIEISPEQETLTFIGAKQQMTAVVKDGNGNVMDLEVVWYSLQPNIADVDATGLVRALADGTATIVAEVPSLRASAQIEVRRFVTQIVFDQEPFTLNAGQSQLVTAFAADESGAPIHDAPIVWSVANSAIASVSSTGLVRGLAEGTTQVIVRSGNHEARLAVTVIGTLALGSASGTVRHATTGAAIADAVVQLRTGTNNTSGTVLHATTTNASGQYTFGNLAAGTYTVAVSRAGFVDGLRNITVETRDIFGQDLALVPVPTAGQIRVVLTWGPNPRDLDSHLLFSGNEFGFHIYYGFSNPSGGGPYFANLDRDDTSGFGPETITITRLLSGTYTYYVHHFSGSQSIATSEARVEVYFGATRVATFSPPSQSGGTWTVFRIQNGEVVPVNTISSSVASARPLLGPAQDALSRVLRDINENPKPVQTVPMGTKIGREP